MSRPFLHNAWTVTKVVFARLRFLSVFIIAAVIIGYWDNIKNHVDKWTRPTVPPEVAGATSDIEYYCSMHPNIIRAAPGNCPICGMPLVKRKKGQAVELPADVLARVQLSPQRVALAGVQTSAVEYRALVREIHALGVLDYDETKVAQISARVAGRADKLFLQYTGQQVKAGDPVYSIYSPEVYTALREYLLARRRVNDLPADASPGARADAVAVYNATMQKLVLWGISPRQLEEMEHEFDATAKVPSHLMVSSPISGVVIRKDIFEGGYVNVGDRPYTIADLSTLWLQAKIYERDVPLVHIGQEAMVTVEALPNDLFKGTVAFLAYQLDANTRTLDARIEVSNVDMILRPGMFADAGIRMPVSPASSPHALAGESQSEGSGDAGVFAAALQSYLGAQKLLSQDRSDNVSALLHEAVEKLEPLRAKPQAEEGVKRLESAVHQTMGQDLAGIRETFKEVSAAMIELGKMTKLPADAPLIQVFRCPMKKANWLQEAGATLNPYYGSEMLDCGGAIETLAKAGPAASPTTRPTLPAGKVLAVPRSAVIDTGRHKIVYVESSPGVFDQRAIQVGAPTDDFYPIVSGLDQGQRVVTAGAFLIDSENRLNPTAAAPASAGTVGHRH